MGGSGDILPSTRCGNQMKIRPRMLRRTKARLPTWVLAKERTMNYWRAQEGCCCYYWLSNNLVLVRKKPANEDKEPAMVVMFGGAGSSSVNPNINRFEERLREKIRGEFLITWIMNEWFPLPLRFVLESAMRTKTTTTRWSHNEVSV